MAAPTTKPANAAPAKKTETKSARERMTTVGTKRVSKVLKALRNLQPVANRKSYEYTSADVTKIFSAIDAEVSAVKATFNAALEGKAAAKAEAGFSL
jgi:hypothetical protein